MIVSEDEDEDEEDKDEEVEDGLPSPLLSLLIFWFMATQNKKEKKAILENECEAGVS
eukprot:m.135891 g.135891  ORF g.135891 m.135891 type:complete len:57 (-) comp10278_c0_seq1:74-244(-)